MDATYRSELRELNDLNCGRFQARLDSTFDRVEARMAGFEARIVRWMFIFWVGSLGTCIALLKL